MHMLPWCEEHHKALRFVGDKPTDCLKVGEDLVKGTMVKKEFLEWDFSSWWCPVDFEENDDNTGNRCAKEWVVKVAGHTIGGGYHIEKFILD